MEKFNGYLLMGLLGCVVACCAWENGIGRSGISSTGEERKLFGGYRITPKHCKATKASTTPSDAQNICMFHDECVTRKGQVVGACMDGFLFGACCQLPKDTMVGEYLDQSLPIVTSVDNSLSTKVSATTHRTTPVFADIPSNSVSQIAASLLTGNSPPFSGNAGQNILPTGDENSVVEISGTPNWSTTGVTHPHGVETIINNEDNEIKPIFFSPTKKPMSNIKKTTMYSEPTTTRYADTYPPPILQISVSNAPVGYTPIPTIQKPIFRPKPPKPTDQNYVLVPTITHDTAKPSTLNDDDNFVKIQSSNNHTSSTAEPLMTFSYVSSSSPSSNQPPATSRKPPSTSYIFSSTIPPKRTHPTSTKKKKPSKTTIINKLSSTSSKPPSTSYVYSSTFKPTKASKPQSSSYVYSSTFRPTTLAHSTWANSQDAFPGSSSTSSYVYGSGSTRPATISSSIAGPGFTVTSQPLGQYSSYPSPAPTVIVLNSEPEENEDGYVVESSSSSIPTSTTPKPAQFGNLPQRKPVNHVTINNHVTQNIYSTERPLISSSISTSPNTPSPTVIITPKPSISSTYAPAAVPEDGDSVVVTSANDLINFPPDRNPNISHPGLNEFDITTPGFIEDEAMKEKVESFVNQIIYGLQGPFSDLKEIINVKNTTSLSSNSVTTKRPVKKPVTTTKKPVVRPNTLKTTTKRPATTRRTTTSAAPTKRQTTTTKRPVTTKKSQTTTQNLIETVTDFDVNYRDGTLRKKIIYRRKSK